MTNFFMFSSTSECSEISGCDCGYAADGILGVAERLVKAVVTDSTASHAPDKRAAIKTLLELKDPKEILAHSGWKPGFVD
ncbi:MAG TPA: hypothetical protein VIY68_08750 [Steroidobacteraceae bacterium]